MHLTFVIVFTMAGVFTAMVCVRRAILGGKMDGSFEEQKLRRPSPRLDVPTRTVIRKVSSLQDGTVSLDPSEIAIPIEAAPLLPRAS